MREVVSPTSFGRPDRLIVRAYSTGTDNHFIEEIGDAWRSKGSVEIVTHRFDQLPELIDAVVDRYGSLPRDVVLVVHGDDGKFMVGDLVVSLDFPKRFTRFTEPLRLAARGDGVRRTLHLVGCRVGATMIGFKFLHALASGTGMNVRASNVLQAVRMIQYRDAEGLMDYVHTLKSPSSAVDVPMQGQILEMRHDDDGVVRLHTPEEDIVLPESYRDLRVGVDKVRGAIARWFASRMHSDDHAHNDFAHIDWKALVHDAVHEALQAVMHADPVWEERLEHDNEGRRNVLRWEHVNPLFARTMHEVYASAPAYDKLTVSDPDERRRIVVRVIMHDIVQDYFPRLSSWWESSKYMNDEEMYAFLYADGQPRTPRFRREFELLLAENKWRSHMHGDVNDDGMLSREEVAEINRRLAAKA